MGTRDGDVAEFEVWYEAVHPRLVTSIMLLSGDVDLARDVVDEACCRALERWSRVSQMESPDGWAYVVAVHELRRRAARRRRERTVVQQDVPRADAPTAASEFSALIAGLTERQRTAVVLRHVGDLPEKEIADAMKVSRSTVSSTLRDAYDSLRATLAAQTEEVADDCSA